MQTHTMVRGAPPSRLNMPALAVGALLSSISAFVLLRDVFAGALVTPAHVMTVGAIVAAIWSGLEVWSQIAARRFIAGFGLAVIFAAATSYVVLMSGANGAATVASKAAEVEANNAARERELKQLARAEKMHADTTDELQAKCVKGKASKGTCDGLRTTLNVYSAAITGHQSRLAELQPPAEAGGAYASIARVLAAMPGVTAEVPALTERLELLIPFLAAIVAELGAIVALHLGIRNGSENAPIVRERQVDNSPKKPVTPRPRRGRKADPKVVDFSNAFRARHGRPPTYSEIRSEFPNMAKATASDYARRAREAA
jgi:hypothetical protein